MATKRSKSVNICAVRITRLDPVTGELAPGPHNSYTLKQMMSLAFDPEIDQGASDVQRGGCDCVVAQRKAPDILIRWNLTLNPAFREPGLEEMLTGGAVITDAAGTPNIIGVNFPLPAACGVLAPAVAIEAWSKAWSGRQQRADTPWIRWFWKYTVWRPAGGTLENGFQDPSFVGYSQENDVLDFDAIYGDVPDGAVLLPGGGWYHDTAIPGESSPEYTTASSS